MVRIGLSHPTAVRNSPNFNATRQLIRAWSLGHRHTLILFRVGGDALDDFGTEAFKATVESIESIPAGIVAPVETDDLEPSSMWATADQWMFEEGLAKVELVVTFRCF